MEKLQALILTASASIMFLCFAGFCIYRMTEQIRRRNRRRTDHIEEMRDVVESIYILLREKFNNQKSNNDEEK